MKKRNRTTESFAKQVIADLIAHWKERRLPREGIWGYAVLAVLIFSLGISPILTVVIVIVLFFLAQLKVRPNIRPKTSDEQIDKWLAEDRKELFENIPGRLDVILVRQGEDTPEELLNVVVSDIPLSSGYILKKEDNFPDSPDYFCEKGMDDKIRYSIHVFMRICLCKNFMTYYKCYWNFTKGAAISVETGEYLYDMIVSVKTKELSSASLTEGIGEKIVLKEELMIGTTDGKEINFPAIIDPRLSYESSLEEQQKSTIENAVLRIRRLLRERRIDMQIVKSFDVD